MENLNATATLAVAIDTTAADEQITKLEQKLARVGTTNMTGLGAGSQEAAARLRTLEAEVDSLSTSLQRNGQAREALSRITRSWSAVDGAARVSMRESANLSAEQVKAMAQSAEAMKNTLRSLKMESIGLDTQGAAKVALVGRIKDTFKAVQIAAKEEAGRASSVLREQVKNLQSAYESLSKDSSVGSGRMKSIVEAMTSTRPDISQLNTYYKALETGIPVYQRLKEAGDNWATSTRSSVVKAVDSLTGQNKTLSAMADYYRKMEQAGVQALGKVQAQATEANTKFDLSKQKAAAKEQADMLAGMLKARDDWEKLGKAQAEATAINTKRDLDLQKAAAKEQKQILDGMLRAREDYLSKLSRATAKSVSYQSSSPAQQAQMNFKAGIALATGADTSGYAAEALAAARAAGSVDALREAKAKLVPQTKQLSEANRVMSRTMDELHVGARGLAGSFNALWMTYGSLAPLLAGAALGAAFKSTLSKGAEFEYQLTFVKALGGESADAVERLSRAAMDLGRDGLYGPLKVAEGMRILAQAGLTAQEQLVAIPQVLDLSTVGELGVEAAAETLVGVATAFGKSKLELQGVGDVIAKAAAVSQTSVQAMTESMKYASVVGEQYNVSLEDTSTALAVLARLNITGTSAGTSFRNMVKELYTPTNEASKAFKLLGLETKNADGSMRNMVDIIYDLRGRLEPYDKASQTNILQKMFGERGAKEAIAMLAMTREEWNKLEESIRNSNGFMGQVAAELEATTKGTLAQAFNTLEASLIEVFSTSKYGMGELAGDLKNLFGSEEFKSAVASFVAVAGGAAQALLEYKEVVVAVAEGYVLGKLVLGIEAVTVALGGMTVASAAAAGGTGMGLVARAGATVATALGPLAGPLGVVALLATGFLALWTNMKGGDDATNKVVESTDRILDVMERQNKKIEAGNDALRERIRLAAGMKAQEDQDTPLGKVKSDTKNLHAELLMAEALGKDNGLYAERAAKLRTLYAAQLEKQKKAEQLAADAEVGQGNAKVLGALATTMDKEKEEKSRLKAGTKSVDNSTWANQRSGGGSGAKHERYDDKQALRQSGELLARIKADWEGTKVLTQYESQLLALKEKLESKDSEEAFKFKNGETREKMAARIKEIEDYIPKVNARVLAKEQTTARVAEIENGIQEEQASLAEREKMLQRSYALSEINVGQYYQALEMLREESYKKARDDYDAEIKLLTELQQKYEKGTADYIETGKKIKDVQTKQNKLDTAQSGKRNDMEFERDNLFNASNGFKSVMHEVQVSAADLATTVRDGLKGSLDIAANGFVNLAMTGKMSIRGMVADMLSNLARLTAHKAFMMIANMAMTAAMGAYVGAASSAVPTANPSPIMGMPGVAVAAKGAAFGDPSVSMFAAGGAFDTNSVLTAPTMFRHPGGLGVAGEAGPEAIMPLTRDNQGRLGVRSSGGGGGGDVVVNLQVNVTVEKGSGDGKQTGSDVVSVIAPQIKAMIMNTLMEQKRPGGVLN